MYGMKKQKIHTIETKEKISKSMRNNNNAEIWTYDEASEFINTALSMSFNPDYDFIGEILQDLKQDKGTLDYIVNKYSDLSRVKNHILSNCETNCFRNSKKGNIREATAIVNLKSNHGWTDRTKTEIGGEIKTGQNINLTDAQLKEVLNEFKPKRNT